MKISLIAALAENRTIGREGGLPWRLSADLKRFKRITLGHHLLMGRKTFDSIGRALPGRTTLVVSRDRVDLPERVPEGVLVAPSVEAALELARGAGEDELFVAGGAEIFAATLDRADRLYLTRVEAEVEGDTLFPEWGESSWRRLSVEAHAADERNDYPVRFEVWERAYNAPNRRGSTGPGGGAE